MRTAAPRAAFALAFLALAPRGAAGPDGPGEEAGAHLVFAQGTSLWRAPIDATADSSSGEEIADLGRPAAEVTAIHASRSRAGGAVFLVEAGDEIVVVRDGAESARVAPLPCDPPAHLSADGGAALCSRRGAPARVALDRLGSASYARVFPGAGDAPAGFLGASASEAITIADGAICAADFLTRRRRCLAPHAPTRGRLRAAPSGDRAAARYDRGDGEVLYTFRLDGEGVRRALLSGARAVAWSEGGSWLAAQEDGRACLVRAVGGQYQCWGGYRAIDLAPDGGAILMARSSGQSVSFHVAPLGGTSPTPPTRVAAGADTEAAAWVTGAGPGAGPGAP